MHYLFSKARVYRGGRFGSWDVAVEGDKISAVEAYISPTGFDRIIPCEGLSLVPGFADVHVHLREPGFSYKETIRTGTEAAARGGYTAVCAMPNVEPPPDCAEHLEQQLHYIADSALINVYPYGCISRGREGIELSDMPALAKKAVAFSDDGSGVQEAGVMLKAMETAAGLGKLIAAHCEDLSKLSGGYIHAGEYARINGHSGIPSISEWAQIERDIALVRKTRCRYHVCHVSTKEGVELVRRAKEEGLPVTCETAPHYLTLTDADIKDDGRFKMNPPLRSAADKDALILGIADGTVDVIATDHAPHSEAEKSGGLRSSAMGIVGIETAFPILYPRLVMTGVIRFERLVELMSVSPRRVFNLPGGLIEPGCAADMALLDTRALWRINPLEFYSKGRSTPFAGWEVFGQTALTMASGRIVYERRVNVNA